jgi:hypothetical protein
MSLSNLDKIKLKTHQILVKTDDYFTTTKNGMDASHHGIMFGAAAVTAGILGVAAIVTTAPALPFISTVAALASIPTFTVGGAAVNLAGATLLGGGSAGIVFTALAKMYKSVRGDRDYHVNGDFECWTKDGSELTRVSRKEILKDIENGTFSQKYDAIKVSAPENSKGYNRFVVPDNNSLEVTASLPYKIYNKEILPNATEWEDDCKKVRRECFKEAKNSNLKASIMNRISNFREKIEGISEKKKYTI